MEFPRIRRCYHSQKLERVLGGSLTLARDTPPASVITVSILGVSILHGPHQLQQNYLNSNGNSWKLCDLRCKKVHHHWIFVFHHFLVKLLRRLDGKYVFACCRHMQGTFQRIRAQVRRYFAQKQTHEKYLLGKFKEYLEVVKSWCSNLTLCL